MSAANGLDLSRVAQALPWRDRLVLVLTIARSLLWPWRSPVASKEAAIARIQTLVDRLWRTEEIFQVVSKAEIMARFNGLLDGSPEMGSVVLAKSHQELRKIVADIMRIEGATTSFAKDLTAEQIEAFDEAVAGR